MTATTLEDATSDFVLRLNKVVGAAIDTPVEFVADFETDGYRAAIQASKSYTRRPAFPLVRQNDDPKAPALLLGVRYIVELARGGEYLRVVTSTIGLWVDVTGGRKKHRPLIRLEYDRKPRAPNRPAAHVHLHANSPEMAWVFGSSGRAAPDLHALHFPVGGQRFRPTLEDFLLFLDREMLYTEFKPDWRQEVQRSLRWWEEVQAASTVKECPEIAVGVLEKLGYVVGSPGDAPHPAE